MISVSPFETLNMSKIIILPFIPFVRFLTILSFKMSYVLWFDFSINREVSCTFYIKVKIIGLRMWSGRH